MQRRLFPGAPCPCTKTSVMGSHVFPQSRVYEGEQQRGPAKPFPLLFPDMEHFPKEPGRIWPKMNDVAFGQPFSPVTLKAFGKALSSLASNCNNLDNMHNDSVFIITYLCPKDTVQNCLSATEINFPSLRCSHELIAWKKKNAEDFRCYPKKLLLSFIQLVRM